MYVANETVPRRLVVSGEAVRAALNETLAAEPGIVAAYLFGSFVRGAAGPLSDLDVALLVRETREGGAVRERTMDALCRRLGTSHVDVVLLGDAPMPLRYRVVRDGSLVVCRDGAMLERFVADTVLQYLDFKPLRDGAFRVMRNAILENR